MQKERMAETAVCRPSQYTRFLGSNAAHEKRTLDHIRRKRTEMHLTHAGKDRRQKGCASCRHKQEKDLARRLFKFF